jgi:hypothetical protein
MQIVHINYVYYIQQFLKAMWHGPFGGLLFKGVWGLGFCMMG